MTAARRLAAILAAFLPSAACAAARRALVTSPHAVALLGLSFYDRMRELILRTR
jgi:hypothetical protein